MWQRAYDGDQRLLHLIRYCKGKEREAIKEFVVLPPEVGYKRACGILMDLFGRPHEAAQSRPDGLLQGIKTGRFDGGAICGSALRLKGCIIALVQMAYTVDLISLPRLSRYSLQSKWAENIDGLTQNGRPA